jgi:SSS family solute:Na+ symporter
MTTLDWLIILAYFGVLLVLTWWVILKNRDTADDYFLAGRNLGWLIVGASIFASNIGSEHLVGLAGSGATSGVALAHYELRAWCLLVLGWTSGSTRRAASRRSSSDSFSASCGWRWTRRSR